MVWLNRSPIPVGRRGVKYFLVLTISTCLPSRRGGGGGSVPCDLDAKHSWIFECWLLDYFYVLFISRFTRTARYLDPRSPCLTAGATFTSAIRFPLVRITSSAKAPVYLISKHTVLYLDRCLLSGLTNGDVYSRGWNENSPFICRGWRPYKYFLLYFLKSLPPSGSIMIFLFIPADTFVYFYIFLSNCCFLYFLS